MPVCVASQFGVVRDLIILNDKATRQPRGAAFVSYATRAEASAAIAGLDRQVQLPGAENMLEVRQTLPRRLASVATCVQVNAFMRRGIHCQQGISAGM
jgi:RNA recognition motif-containing protein